MIAPFTGNPDLDHFLNNLEDFLFPGATAAGGPVPSYEPVGTAAAYLFQYLHVRYADNNVGSGFSNVQTNKLYLGLFNSTSSVESVNPADYTWSLVSGGGFGTTKSFYYRVVPGRSVDYIVGTIAPSNFVVDTGAAINLVISSRSYARLCFSKSTENSMNTNPVSVQTLGADSFPGINTWGTGETWTELAPALLTDEILFRTEGVYNPATDYTTWNAPFVSDLDVGSLSAINPNLGIVTGGELIIGTNPTISGTTMTGSGTHVYPDGRFALGDPARNIVNNGSVIRLNGFQSNVLSNINFAIDNFAATFLRSQLVSVPGNITLEKVSDIRWSALLVGEIGLNTTAIRGYQIQVFPRLVDFATSIPVSTGTLATTAAGRSFSTQQCMVDVQKTGVFKNIPAGDYFIMLDLSISCGSTPDNTSGGTHLISTNFSFETSLQLLSI